LCHKPKMDLTWTWHQRVFLEVCNPSTRSQLVCSWERRLGCTTAIIEFVRRQLTTRSNISILFVCYARASVVRARETLEQSIDKDLIQLSRLDCLQLTNRSKVHFATSSTWPSSRSQYPTILVFDAMPIREVVEASAIFYRAEFVLANLFQGEAYACPKKIVNYDLSIRSYMRFHLYLILRKLFRDGDLVRVLVLCCCG
jgi:hypothetical protein